jgi:hypothetical protein
LLGDLFLFIHAFSYENVESLYLQHTSETGQKFGEGAIARAFELTGGQPWLANALAREVIEEIKVPQNETITVTHFNEAAQKEKVLKEEIGRLYCEISESEEINKADLSRYETEVIHLKDLIQEKNIIIDKLQNTIDNLKILNYKKYLNKDLNTNQWNNKIYELAISDNIIITNIIEKISSIINNNLNYSNYNSDSNLNYTNYKTIINLNNDSITNELILIIEKLVSEI